VPVANIVLTALQRDFAPATLSHVSWILGAYALAAGIAILPRRPDVRDDPRPVRRIDRVGTVLAG
jgi:hypothetical protein